MDFTKIEETPKNQSLGLELLQVVGRNVTFELYYNGAFGVFRLHFADKSRKNATRKDLTPVTLYFERELQVKGHLSSSITADSMLDMLLFAQRKQDWILEKLHRENARHF